MFAAWIMWDTQVDKALVIDCSLKNFIMRRWKHVKMILAMERWKQQSDERKQFARAAEKMVLRRRNICQTVAMVQWVEHVLELKNLGNIHFSTRLAQKRALQDTVDIRRFLAQVMTRWVEHLRVEKSRRVLAQKLSRVLFEKPEEDVLMSANKDRSDHSPIKFLDGPRRTQPLTPRKIESENTLSAEYSGHRVAERESASGRERERAREGARERERGKEAKRGVKREGESLEYPFFGCATSQGPP
jgi:hypothetical protein